MFNIPFFYGLKKNGGYVKEVEAGGPIDISI